jgi:MFS family permease
MSVALENHFGWSKSFLFGVFSFGLLLGGLTTPYIGKKLDQYGARTIMSIGSLLAFLGLIFLSQVETKLEFILTIIFIEIVSTFVLYEAAFVAFSQIAKQKARLPMTQITLIAGFASTIFWPLISFLLDFYTWQEVYIILSLFHLFIAFPLHLFTLPNRELSNKQIQHEDNSLYSRFEGKKNTKKSMILIGIALCLIAIPIASIQTHLIGLLDTFGIEAIVAVSLGALIGPAQVGARIFEMTFAKKITPIASSIISTGLLLLSTITLLFCGYSIIIATLFVILFGAGQGLNYIARGSLPLYILGSDNFGKNSGYLNLYIKVVTAMAPFTFALSLENLGNETSVIILLVLSIISIIALYFIPKEKNV